MSYKISRSSKIQLQLCHLLFSAYKPSVPPRNFTRTPVSEFSSTEDQLPMTPINLDASVSQLVRSAFFYFCSSYCDTPVEAHRTSSPVRSGLRSDFRKIFGSVSGRISEKFPVRFPVGFQKNFWSGVRSDFRKIFGPVSGRISEKFPVRFPVGFQKNFRSGLRSDFRKIFGPVSGRISEQFPVRYPVGLFDGIRQGKYLGKWSHISDENCLKRPKLYYWKIPAFWCSKKLNYFPIVLE